MCSPTFLIPRRKQILRKLFSNLPVLNQIFSIYFKPSKLLNLIYQAKKLKKLNLNNYGLPKDL